MKARYDFIIVGAGSAGCVLANRLSADPENEVALIEAGPPDTSPFIHMPAAFSHAVSRAGIDWGYESEPETQLDGRRVPCPRGRVLGGSSSVNAMSFVRGNPADFDDWAHRGLADWSYAHCLPYFRKMECFSEGADHYRGGDGPLNVTAPKFSNPLNAVFLEAAGEAGYRQPINPNGAEQEGFGVMDQTIHRGKRVSTARAYLKPVRQRRNLTVITRAIATRILFEGNRAVGIAYLVGCAAHIAHARCEVIVSAGAINSPQLLMLSGIGPADALRKLDIDVVADSPGVGRNLQDHVDVSVISECTQPVSMTPALRQPLKSLVGLRWLVSKTGPVATNHFEAAGYLRTRPDMQLPNIQLVFIPLMVSPQGVPYDRPHGFQATVLLLRPQSRGCISLRSADPTAAPVMRFNYLEHPEDLDELREGVIACRRLFAQHAFDAYRGTEVLPGDDVQKDGELDAFIRGTVKSTHHPSCTCRMGSDDGSVVDAAGRVRGTASLRVVDASILPAITSGNINAPTIMLAEKLADSILGKPPLEPETPE